MAERKYWWDVVRPNRARIMGLLAELDITGEAAGFFGKLIDFPNYLDRPEGDIAWLSIYLDWVFGSFTGKMPWIEGATTTDPALQAIEELDRIVPDLSALVRIVVIMLDANEIDNKLPQFQALVELLAPNTVRAYESWRELTKPEHRATWENLARFFGADIEALEKKVGENGST